MIAPNVRSALAGAASATRPVPSVERIRERQAAVTERAAAHFDKHKDGWVTKKYGDLLRNDGPRPSLQPPGHVEDRSSRLMRAAEHLVNRKQANRLQRIEAGANRMVHGVDRGVGL